MNYNTQNAKIASITEKTLIIGIDVGVRRTMPEHFTGEITSIPENHLHSAMMNPAFWRFRHGWMRLLKSIIRKP